MRLRFLERSKRGKQIRYIENSRVWYVDCGGHNDLEALHEKLVKVLKVLVEL